MRKLILFLLCLAAGFQAGVCRFERDGIYYEVVSESDRTLEVTATEVIFNGASQYSGDVDIPPTVMLGTKEYTVTRIGKGAFRNCSCLTSVTIPNTVNWIFDEAFYGCRALTSLNIPCPGAIIIGAGAFSGCSGLTSITMSPLSTLSTIQPKTFYWCSSLESMVIPNMVEWIGSDAFHGCTSLESVTVPNTVKGIQSRAFYGCRSLQSVVIPGSVTTIESQAFYGCSALPSVTIPSSVTTIGNDVFGKCTALEAIEVDGENKDYASIDGALYDKDVTTLIRCPERKASLTLPGTVTKIDDRAFQDCALLPSATLPNTMKEIPSFRGCRALHSLTIPQTVTWVDNFAFDGCTALEAIEVDGENGCYASVDGALYDKDVTTLIRCPEGKTSLSIPNTVKEIGYDACRNCSLLQSLSIPNTVTEIGNEAFRDCSLLQSVTLPDSLTIIYYRAFYGCGALQSLSIPNTVTLIADSAFYHCTALTSLTIPDTDMDVNDCAFCDCGGLDTLILSGPQAEIHSRAFSGCYGLKAVICLAAAPKVLYRAFSDYTYNTATLYWGGCSDINDLDSFKNKASRAALATGIGHARERGGSVWSDKGVIRVEGGDMACEVYDLHGRLVAKTRAGAIGGLAPGVYLVKTGGGVFKIAL